MIVTSETNSRPRSSGVLLHVTSLPGPYGIGDLGPAARSWVKALARARQTWWQVLPMGPTGYGDSPYQCFSAFGGNPLLISPDLLLRDRLLEPADVAGADFPTDRVHFETVIPWKNRILDRAWATFQTDRFTNLAAEYDGFCAAQADWLDDFALFMALKDAHQQVSWQQWPTALAHRQAAALELCRQKHADRIGRHKFGQFLFFRQWAELKAHARASGVRLLGDMPIFVATDCADVWAKPDLFLLNADRQPTFVAGVPPDYFSETGQYWGNPVYDWPAHRRSNYQWWSARLRSAFAMVDLVRLDHFRGFEAAWHIPAGSPTAQTGQWTAGPGADFFDVALRALGDLPLIAEDLGVITPAVENLRNRYGLPGMRILQFAFGGEREDRFLPHRYDRNTVVYTGTHDNDTTMGWYDKLTPAEIRRFRRYAPGADAAWDLIRLAWASVADRAIVPLQDILGLDNSARMNVPGQPRGNWRWRFAAETMTDALIERLSDMTEAYERAP